jgi:hypothetical protein
MREFEVHILRSNPRGERQVGLVIRESAQFELEFYFGGYYVTEAYVNAYGNAAQDRDSESRSLPKNWTAV